ncbi:MAG: hypothetical protein GQ544_09785 [Candidatus Aminicenantes bacterium]|nr:hypothetical protein [Candidatus Aminicenantes bacterium]
MGLLLTHDLDPLTSEEVAKLDPSDVNAFDRGAIHPKRKTLAGDYLLLGSLLLPLLFIPLW